MKGQEGFGQKESQQKISLKEVLKTILEALLHLTYYSRFGETVSPDIARTLDDLEGKDLEL